MAEHFIKELGQPITIKQDEISRDLYRFVEQFPVDLIPFKSENEVQIENIVKRIKKLQSKKINHSQNLKQLEEDALKNNYDMNEDKDFSNTIKMLLVRKTTSFVDKADDILANMTSITTDYDIEKKKLLEIEIIQEQLKKKMAELQDV